MKFGMALNEYLDGNRERLFQKCSHVEYKRLKKVLKSCRVCRSVRDQEQDEKSLCGAENEKLDESGTLTEYCQCDSCPSYTLLQGSMGETSDSIAYGAKAMLPSKAEIQHSELLWPMTEKGGTFAALKNFFEDQDAPRANPISQLLDMRRHFNFGTSYEQSV